MRVKKKCIHTTKNGLSDAYFSHSPKYVNLIVIEAAQAILRVISFRNSVVRKWQLLLLHFKSGMHFFYRTALIFMRSLPSRFVLDVS